MVSQIISLTIVYSTFYSGTDQRKHQSSVSQAFVRGIHWSPVNSPHKGPVTQKCFHLMMSSCLGHWSAVINLGQPWYIWTGLHHPDNCGFPGTKQLPNLQLLPDLPGTNELTDYMSATKKTLPYWLCEWWFLNAGVEQCEKGAHGIYSSCRLPNPLVQLSDTSMTPCQATGDTCALSPFYKPV